MGGDEAEGFEQRPVFEIVSVAGAIVDAIEVLAAGFEGSELREAARSVTLEQEGIEIIDAKAKAFCGETMTKIGDPFDRVDIGLVTCGARVTEEAIFAPLARDKSQRKEVVVAFDLLQLGRERGIETKAWQGFEKAGELLVAA